MMKLILVVGLYIIAPTLAQIDTIPQRFRHGNAMEMSSATTHGDDLGRTSKINSNLRNNRELIGRSLQDMSMSIPHISPQDMSMSIPDIARDEWNFGGGGDPSSDLPTYSPLPAPNGEGMFDVDEVVSWICRFCPSSICSNCPSA